MRGCSAPGDGGVQRQGAREGRQRFPEAAGLAQGIAQIHPGIGIAGPQPQRALQQGQGGGTVAALGLDHPEQMQRIEVPRFTVEHLPISPGRRVQATLAVQGHGRGQQGVSVVGQGALRMARWFSDGGSLSQIRGFGPARCAIRRAIPRAPSASGGSVRGMRLNPA